MYYGNPVSEKHSSDIAKSESHLKKKKKQIVQVLYAGF